MDENVLVSEEQNWRNVPYLVFGARSRSPRGELLNDVVLKTRSWSVDCYQAILHFYILRRLGEVRLIVV